MADENKNYTLFQSGQERVYTRYGFEVDATGQIVSVNIFSGGTPDRVYTRAADPQQVTFQQRFHPQPPIPEGVRDEDAFNAYLQHTASPEYQEAAKPRLSEPSLVDLLGLSDPIVRDAFIPNMTAAELFSRHHLVPQKTSPQLLR